jgi:hypothetical protein
VKAPSKVETLLARQAPAKRVKAMLSLSEPLYAGLRHVCDERGVGVSEMVDALVEDLLSRVPPGSALKSAEDLPKHKHGPRQTTKPDHNPRT